MKILVLTSKQNFVWHSMQEIIPHIESSWRHSTEKTFNVTVLDVDNLKLEDIVPHSLPATHIVLTCFNYKIFKIAAFLRENLGLPINFIIYVHNMATIAFWPFRNWSQTDFFRANDIFVTSCQNDLKTLHAVFSNPMVVKFPFYLLNAVENHLNKSFTQISDLVYIGRLSPQKNLHNLILAYSTIKKKKSLALPPLTLFGKEDDLGSPNMELKQTGYLSYLKGLVKDLDLTAEVHFLGHQNRESSNIFLTEKRWLAISPSLHSDENFGMAILQSLVAGNRCLISDWGGHSDFKSYFSERTSLMKVSSSLRGPVLSAQTLADSIEFLLRGRISEAKVSIHPDYNIENCLSGMIDLLKLPFSAAKLGFSPLANAIYHQKQNLFGNSKMQIFSDYQDPLFHEISTFYIGRESQTEEFNPKKRYGLVPWVELQDAGYKIMDPHKGEFYLDIENEDSLKLLFDSGYLIRED